MEDFEFDFDEEDPGLGAFEDLEDAPKFRATIADGRLMLIPWTPHLAFAGPLGVMARQRGEDGVTIVDLSAPGPRELIATQVANGSRWPSARRTLLRWARIVGYRRVWLPDRVVDLEPPRRALGEASVHCPTCHMHWTDGSPDFWAFVHENGSFPRWCTICGSGLPQWEVAPS
jgi:hypothetical protein